MNSKTALLAPALFLGLSFSLSSAWAGNYPTQVAIQNNSDTDILLTVLPASVNAGFESCSGGTAAHEGRECRVGLAVKDNDVLEVLVQNPTDANSYCSVGIAVPEKVDLNTGIIYVQPKVHNYNCAGQYAADRPLIHEEGLFNYKLVV